MATSAQLAKKLADYDANRKSSADILNEALTQHGVPELRTRVAGLRTTLTNTESALNAVDPSVTGRTSRSLVTEAQRQRMVNKEREPIAQQYGQQSNLLTNENASLAEQQRAADQLAQGRMNDYTIGRTALQSQYEGAVGRESESRRRAEADRAYRLERERAKRARIDSDRNYRLAVQQANKPSGGGGGGSKRISEGEAASVIAKAFKRGRDGYISPSQWNSLLNEWESEGLSAASFVSRFQRYANPAHYRTAKNAKRMGAYSGIKIKK